jgi:hypothetical protein
MFMNNRKPIPRSELQYPHVVERAGHSHFKILDTSHYRPKVVGVFDSKDEAIAHAKDLNHLYLQSVGWYQREKRAHDSVKTQPSLVPLLTLVLILALFVHLL